MTHREQLIQNFLQNTAWQHARQQPLDQDASFRRYWRLSLADKSILLMDAPPPEKPVSLFADIARFLRQHDLHAPRIDAMDEAHGLMLIEDFGNDTFTRLLQTTPTSEARLYDLAVDTLIQLHQIESFRRIELPHYDRQTLLEEARLLIDWFYPATMGSTASSEQHTSFNTAWLESIAALEPHREVLVLRDYHVDNLMRLSDRDGELFCGLLDFQDALIGSPAYDLMSLIEDARREISPQLKARCLQRYTQAMSNVPAYPGQRNFEQWLNVLAAQRHAKVLGIFVRLFKRDNKAIYLEHLPRVLALYASALNREPLLKPVSDWMEQNLPISDIDLDAIYAC